MIQFTSRRNSRPYHIVKGPATTEEESESQARQSCQGSGGRLGPKSVCQHSKELIANTSPPGSLHHKGGRRQPEGPADEQILVDCSFTAWEEEREPELPRIHLILLPRTG